MIKDDKDTTYNASNGFHHYWIDLLVGMHGMGIYALLRTVNGCDEYMEDEQGNLVTSTSYRELYDLAKKLHKQNTEDDKL